MENTPIDTPLYTILFRDRDISDTKIYTVTYSEPKLSRLFNLDPSSNDSYSLELKIVMYTICRVIIKNDLQFYVLLNHMSFSVISGRWEDDNERMFATEPRLQLKRLLRPGIEFGTTRSLDQILTH